MSSFAAGRVVRPAAVALTIAAAAACGPAAPNRRPLPPSPAPEGPAAAAKPHEWVPTARMLVADAHGERLGLISGVRVRSSSKATSFAEMVADPPLREFAPVPRALGGGYLFWNLNAVYRAKSFLGPLEPVVSTNVEVARIRFGPRGALVSNVEGERYGLDLKTGRRIPPTPVGVVDVVALSERRAVGILESGISVTTNDGGETWSDISKYIAGAPIEISKEHGALWIMDEATTYRVDGPDAVLQFDAMPTTRDDDDSDPRWGRGVPPRELATLRGVNVGEGKAIVAKQGNIAVVDMERDEIIDFVPGALPPGLSCTAELHRADLLFLCKSGDRNAALRYSTESREAVLEHAFTGSGKFHSDGGESLLFAGRCSGISTDDDVVCVRTGNGWEQLDATEALDQSPQAGRDGRYVLAWIPRPEGAAALVTGPEGGLVDLRTGRSRELSAVTLERLENLVAHLGRDQSVDRRFHEAPDGTLIGWGREGSFSVTPSGELDLSPYTFRALAIAGPNAIGRGDTGQLFQTTDWGQTWSPIRGPTEGAPAPNPSQCGSVGCMVGGWMRLGWPQSEPTPPSRPNVADPPPREPGVSRPSLQCEPAGPRKASARTLDDPRHNYGLGARTLLVEQGDRAWSWSPLWHEVADPWGQQNRESSLRGMAHGPIPSGDPHSGSMQFPGTARERGLSRDHWFVPMFEPSAPIEKRSISLGALWEAAMASGGAPFSFDGDSDGLTVALPVLSEPGKPTGLLTIPGNGPMVWLSEQAKPRALRLGQQNDYLYPMSAVQLGSDLALLVLDEDLNMVRILRMKGGAFAEVASFAPDVDTTGFTWLGVGPGDELAVLRVPSFVMPTESSPPIAVVPGRMPEALAPWDRLVPATAPECRAPGGYRAIVQTFMPWISAAPERQLEIEASTFALVRWKKDVICLEAIETDYAYERTDWDYAMLSRVVAQFTPKPSAGLVGMTPGAEMRQPMTCRLVPASENPPSPPMYRTH